MRVLILIVMGLFLSACGKDFLEAKPDKTLVVPKTLDDYQALLDDMIEQNQTPGLIEFATDDFIATDAAIRTVPNQMVANVYLWKRMFMNGTIYQIGLRCMPRFYRRM